jgi:hypothetical protein
MHSINLGECDLERWATSTNQREGAFDQMENSYPFHDPNSYDPSSRVSFPVLASLNGSSHEHSRAASATGLVMKQEDHHPLSIDGGSSANPARLHYMDLPGVNPLMSHERLFLNSYNQTTIGSPLGAFTPINRYASNRVFGHCEQDHRALASEQGDSFSKPDNEDRKDFKLTANGLWDPENTHELINDELDPAQLDI